MGMTTLPESPAELGKSDVNRKPRADAVRNRKRIIAAARDIFLRLGPEAQMEGIAKAAGVGVGTLYRNFPTKAALVIEVASEKFAEEVGLMEAAAAHPDAANALNDTVMRWAEFAVGTQQLQSLLAELPMSTACASESERYNALLDGLLARARKSGLPAGELNLDDLRSLLCGLGNTIQRGGDWRRCATVLSRGLGAIS